MIKKGFGWIGLFLVAVFLLSSCKNHTVQGIALFGGTTITDKRGTKDAEYFNM